MNEVADRIFKAYDIRGLVEDLSEKVCFRVGQAFGSYVNSDIVCVGMDTRHSSKKVSESLIKGINSTGRRVLLVGEVPNPILYYYALKNKIPGVFVTASHNPASFNGFKFVTSEGTSFVEELKDLKQLFIKGSFTSGSEGKEVIHDAVDSYFSFWKRKVNIKEPVRFIADGFFGVVSKLIPGFFNDFGLNCIGVRNVVKGDFGGFRPEPNEESTKFLKPEIIKNNCSFGVSFDGDSDRSIFLDDKGSFIPGGVMTLTFGRSMVKKGDVLVATIDCISEIESEIKKLGGKVVWTRAGHGFIQDAVIKNNAVFGGEQSSHFYPGFVYSFSDGVASTLLAAELVSKHGSLSEYISQVEIHPTKKLYVHVDERLKHEVTKRMVERLKVLHSGLRMDFMDGIKVFLNDIEWVLIRVSNTNPEVCVAVEGKNEKRVNELIDKYAKMIKEEEAKLK